MENQNISNELKAIHQRLLKFYGPLHWWPGETPLEIMIGAILTQNTSWQNVVKAIQNIKKEGLLDVSALLAISEERLATLIRSSGYYNLKASRLKNFISYFYEKYRGSTEQLFSLEWKVLREELLAINGIGPETADSILLYAGGKPVFVIDAYTRRIFERHGYLNGKESYQDIQQFFMSYLPPQVSLFNEFHAQLVMVGKDYCLKNNPKCRICPLYPLF